MIKPKIIFVTSAFAPHGDDSTYSTPHLCQQIGLALQAQGWDVVLYGLKGSTSKYFKVVEFEGQEQPDILNPNVVHATNSGLRHMVDSALTALSRKQCDAVVSWGHDAHPFSIDQAGLLNIVTFSHGFPGPDAALIDAVSKHKERFGFLSKWQAKSFGTHINDPLWCPVSLPHSANKLSFHNKHELLFAGRVTLAKGIAHAVNVAEKTNKLLSVAGCNFENNGALGKVESSEYAKYIGCLPRTELYHVMRNSKVFLQLQTCVETEAFGIVTAEALYNGLPIVTWECGANTEIVEHDLDGIVVPFGDIDAAAEAAIAIAEWNPARREEVIKRAVSRFSHHAVGVRYGNWIESNI